MEIKKSEYDFTSVHVKEKDELSELFESENEETLSFEEKMRSRKFKDEEEISEIFVNKFLNDNKVAKSMTRNDYYVWVRTVDGTIFDPQFKYFDCVKRVNNLEDSPIYQEASWIPRFCFQLLQKSVIESFCDKKLEIMVDELNTYGYVPHTYFSNFSFFNAYAFQRKHGGKICYGSIGWKTKNSDYVHYEFGGVNYSVLNYMGNLKSFNQPVMFDVVFNRKTLLFLSWIKLTSVRSSTTTLQLDNIDTMQCFKSFEKFDFELNAEDVESGSPDFKKKVMLCFYELANVLGIEVCDIIDGVLENKITFKTIF